MILVSFLAFSFLVRVHAFVRTCTNPDNFRFLHRNKIMSNPGFTELIQDRGLAQCALECMLRKRCNSFSYDHISGSCQLWEHTIEESNVSDNVGTDISNIKDWPSKLAGPCEHHDCSMYEVCKVENTSKKICVVTHCPSPPTVDNARELNSDNRFTRVGGQISYTCREEFRPEGTRICQSDGTWSDFKCVPDCFRFVDQKVVYDGKKRKTAWGLTCQRWDSQTPHTHDYMEYLPRSTLTAAENFCMDPGTFAGFLWCYTTDPHIRWKICGIPQCPDEAVCPTSTSANVKIFPDPTAKKCYKVIFNITQDNKLSWYDAKSMCESSGVLTNILTARGNSFIYGIDSPQETYWIGLQRVGEKWQWTNGTYDTNLQWANDEPRDSSPGTCVMLNNNARYETADCTEKLNYICEVNPKQESPTLISTADTDNENNRDDN